MTSPTNTRPRDWMASATSLQIEFCRTHPGSYLKRDCLSCIVEALTAAYEAGRADAGELEPKACGCGSHSLADPCNCCDAKAGEPCRHEVTIARRESERCVKCGAEVKP